MKKTRFGLLCTLLLAMLLTAAGCGGYGSFSGDKIPGETDSPSIDSGNINGGNSEDGENGENKPSENGSENNTGNQTKPSAPDDGNNENENGDGNTKPEKPDGNDDGAKKENIVIFIAENFEYSVPYLAGDTEVSAPAVPEKDGYTGSWQPYDLSEGGTVTVNAEYSLKEYKITFIADESEYVRTYTVLDTYADIPEIPQKKGYSAEWENFELTYGEPVTVNAIYTLINYKIYFSANGEITERTYTVLDDTVDEPEVPHRAGYTGVWKYGELTYGEDMTAVAEYTPLPHTDETCFKWKLTADKSGYCITEYTGSYSEVIIPATYKGLPVTEIGLSAFCYDEPMPITGVVITENIKTINNYAFADCSALVNAEFSDGLESIGAGAFSNTGIIKINLPDKLKNIGQQAFYGTPLTEIAIPDSVTVIGHYAFMNCKNLTSVITGDGLKELAQSTFKDCSALESVVIGKSVELIEKNVFSKCILLKSVSFAEKEYWYEANDNIENLYVVDPVRLEDTEWAARLLVNSAADRFFKKDY